MKSAVLTRPNLKLFLLGAILIVGLHDLFAPGPMTAAGFSYNMKATRLSDQELKKIVELANARMDPELFMRLSYAFEKRGETKKALFYFRKAEKCCPVDE